MTLTSSSSDRLSRRARSVKPSATLAVSAKVKAMRATGADVIGFGAGEPDFDTPVPVCDAAVNAMRSGRTHYEPTPGAPEARAAIAHKLRQENGIACEPSDVIISSGAKLSLYLALQCLLDPDDGREVILLTPAWVSYRPMVELAGGTVVEVPASVSNDFKVTPEQLAAAITDRTAAIIINSPSNPCGTMYTPQELRALADVIAPHEHVTVIADEIYEKLIFGGIDFLSLGSIEAIADRVITVNGMSKAYAMTGWRIGYLAAPGDGGVFTAAMTRLQSQMTSCITSFCYPAIVAALEEGADDVEKMRRTFGARAEVIVDCIEKWPQVVCPRPTGAFYVFPDVSAHLGRTSPGGRLIDSTVTLADAMLEEAQVGVVPGDDFGECAKTHIRLSFAADEKTIIEGCRRIGDWLSRLS